MKQFKKTTKHIIILALATVLLGCGIQSVTASVDIDTRMVPGNFNELAEQVKPAVVNIRTVKTMNGGGRVFKHFFCIPFGKNAPFKDFFGPFSEGQPQRNFKQRSLGSGFIIDSEGYIVTNNHVVEGADKIKVKLSNEKEFSAELVGRDPKTDLALIKIEAPEDLRPVKIGDSDRLKVGNWVVAVGSPFGLEQTVTAGIVSAKGRVIGAGPYDNFIQTDASINPGNSGGPLVNMKGEVVGINTAIVASGQGIGFAIPVNLAKGIIAQLKSRGEVTRGWLGVGIQDLTPELAEYYGIPNRKGALVAKVYEGDPADKAGIKPKDVIVAVDGKTISSSRELSRIIADTDVGKRTAISIIRNGKERTVQVNLAKRKDTDLEGSEVVENYDGIGIKVEEITAETARQFKLDENEKGVVITSIAPGSKGEDAGILKGDLVKEINHTPIETLNDYRSEMKKIKDEKTVQFLIKRPGAGFLVIKIDLNDTD